MPEGPLSYFLFSFWVFFSSVLFLVFFETPRLRLQKKEILQILFVFAEQSGICTTRAHTSHHRHLFFESAQSLLALLAQRAMCTTFSLLPQASLHCCGLMVSSPGPCASSGGRLPEAFFMVFLLDSKGANVCKSCRSPQELSKKFKRVFSTICLQKSASIQLGTGLSKFAKN